MKKKLTSIIVAIATATMAFTAMPVSAMDIPENIRRDFLVHNSEEFVDYMENILSDTLDEICENEDMTEEEAVELAEKAVEPYADEIVEKFPSRGNIMNAAKDIAKLSAREIIISRYSYAYTDEVTELLGDLPTKVETGEMDYDSAANEFNLRVLEKEYPNIRTEYEQALQSPQYQSYLNRGEVAMCGPVSVMSNRRMSQENINISHAGMELLQKAEDNAPKRTATPAPTPITAPVEESISTVNPASNAAANTVFADTDGLNDVQLAALNNAVSKGIITGYEDNTVRPYGTLTRAEFAAMVSRYKGYEILNDCSFTDAVSHWSSKYVQSCVEKGAINGIGDNLFAPESPVTFYQAAKIVSIISGMTNGADIDGLGGYPLAYLTVGQNKGLFENLTYGVTGEDYNMTRIDAVVMLENTDIPNSETVTTPETTVDTIPKSKVQDYVTFTANGDKLNDRMREILYNAATLLISGEKSRDEVRGYMMRELSNSIMQIDNCRILEENLERVITYLHNDGYHLGMTIVDG